jgi:hypothetical protein
MAECALPHALSAGQHGYIRKFSFDVQVVPYANIHAITLYGWRLADDTVGIIDGLFVPHYS